MANDRSGEGLEEGEERAQGTAEKNYVIARVDGAGKGVLVGVQVVKNAVEKGGRRRVLRAIKR